MPCIVRSALTQCLQLEINNSRFACLMGMMLPKRLTSFTMAGP